MKIDFDKTSDTIYLTFQEGKVDKTIEMRDRMIVDVDKEGNVLGVELLDVTNQLHDTSIADLEKNILNGIPGKITSETPTVV
jgi:uncharacterized protein YuzE